MATPVRTGLLGASAAMAVGAVAVASGLLPGGGQFTVGAGGPTGEQVRTDSPTDDKGPLGGISALPTDQASQSPANPSAPAPPVSSGKASSPSSVKPSVTASRTPKAPPAPPKTTPKKQAPPSGAPVSSQKTTDRAVQTPASPSSEAAQVLALVNQERAKVGCSPLRDDPSLDSLAQSFSNEMAAGGFFDHTDPDGLTPWDRADKAGVKGLGGENIARGQSDPQAVMEAWMNSEGHRANILNCDYTRLGVGIHNGPGGPWWTQDFGF